MLQTAFHTSWTLLHHPMDTLLHHAVMDTLLHHHTEDTLLHHVVMDWTLIHHPVDLSRTKKNLFQRLRELNKKIVSFKYFL